MRIRRALQFAAIGLLISAVLEPLAPAAAMAAGDAAAHSARLFMWIAVILTTLITLPMLTLLIRRTAARSTG
jgi:hypothetical protein